MGKLFAATLFTSAALMFWIQPMVGRMLLPRYGGTPTVWNTCLVFSQFILLLGYLYAHASTTWLRPRVGAIVHIGVLLLPFAILPIGIANEWLPPADSNPIPTLIAQLAFTIGLPMFAVSTTAPLLQRWFADAGHPAPYVLYAASNVGSLGGLFGYPLLVEPYWSLSDQTMYWTFGFIVFAILTLCCGIASSRFSCQCRVAIPSPSALALPRWERARWLGLSAVPASLLIGVTTSVTTDIAAVPMLWVVPLGLYIATFILVFGEWMTGLRSAARFAAPGFAVLQIALLIAYPESGQLSILVRFGILFAIALGLHEELARRRPDPARLTEFFLWVSAGGVLGGLFNTLVAPALFSGIWEYPLALVATVLLGLPGAGMGWDRAGFRRAAIVAFAIGIGTLAIEYIHMTNDGTTLHRERNAFGISRVTTTQTGEFTVLSHGNTVHGAQYRGPKKDAWATPRTYYHPSGPIGDVFRQRFEQNDLRPVGVVGLGAGAIASYGQPKQSFTFFEIDPAVVKIAQNKDWFTYLADSPAECRTVLGDARLSLEREPDGRFGLLVIDAFGGDGVPVHLLTREAMQLYRRKLAPDGILAFNVSNRYLDLASVLGDHAQPEFRSFVRLDRELSEDESKRKGKSPSEWVVFVPNQQGNDVFFRKSNWVELEPRKNSRPWSDQFCDLIGAFR